MKGDINMSDEFEKAESFSQDNKMSQTPDAEGQTREGSESSSGNVSESASVYRYKKEDISRNTYGSTSESTGSRNAYSGQNPYAAGGQSVNGGQNTYGTGNQSAYSSQNTYGGQSSKSTYGAGSQSAYGGPNAYGTAGQNAYSTSQNTYGTGGQNAYGGSQNTYGAGQNAYNNGGANQGNYYQANNGTANKSHTKAKRPKNHTPRRWPGWAKAVCYALIFGVVAGGCMEGIHLIGSSVTSTEVASDAGDTASTNSIGVVKVSSTDVQTIEATDVSDIVAEAMPSIVSVSTVVQTTTQDFFGRTYSQEGSGAGSGIIFSDDGTTLYVVTNYHVVEDSTEISVTFCDETSATATVKGYDENADIAVLTISLSDLDDSTKSAIKAAVLGDSDALEAGNGAIAIGNALGSGQSVTTGCISAVSRTVQLTDGSMDLIQTSAAINPGNSGGALLNTRGEVIGINTAKYSDTDVEGMGFAIPINDALETINGIISGEIVNKSDSDTVYLGIMGGTISESMAEKYGYPQGVYVSSVYSNSAASRAGLQAGYIITGFNGETITTMEELQEALAACTPGDTVTLTVRVPDSEYNYDTEQTLTTILGSKDEVSTSDSSQNSQNSQSNPYGQYGQNGQN